MPISVEECHAERDRRAKDYENNKLDIVCQIIDNLLLAKHDTIPISVLGTFTDSELRSIVGLYGTKGWDVAIERGWMPLMSEPSLRFKPTKMVPNDKPTKISRSVRRAPNGDILKVATSVPMNKLKLTFYKKNGDLADENTPKEEITAFRFKVEAPGVDSTAVTEIALPTMKYDDNSPECPMARIVSVVWDD